MKIGKIVGNNTYKRKKKEIAIGNSRIDAIDKVNSEYSIIEIKKSKKMLKPEIWQLKYYLYISNSYKKKGFLYFSDSRDSLPVNLNDNDIIIINRILDEIVKIINGEIPKIIGKPYCKSCSYYQFCYG